MCPIVEGERGVFPVVAACQLLHKVLLTISGVVWKSTGVLPAARHTPAVNRKGPDPHTHHPQAAATLHKTARLSTPVARPPQTWNPSIRTPKDPHEQRSRETLPYRNPSAGTLEDTDLDAALDNILAADTPWNVIVWNDPVNLMTYVAQSSAATSATPAPAPRNSCPGAPQRQGHRLHRDPRGTPKAHPGNARLGLSATFEKVEN